MRINHKLPIGLPLMLLVSCNQPTDNKSALEIKDRVAAERVRSDARARADRLDELGVELDAASKQRSTGNNIAIKHQADEAYSEAASIRHDGEARAKRLYEEAEQPGAE